MNLNQELGISAVVLFLTELHIQCIVVGLGANAGNVGEQVQETR